MWGASPRLHTKPAQVAACAEAPQAKTKPSIWEKKIWLRQILSFCKVATKILLLESSIICSWVIWALESIAWDGRHFKFKCRSQHYGRNSDINTKQLQSSPSCFPLLSPPKAKTEKNKCVNPRVFTFSQRKEKLRRTCFGSMESQTSEGSIWRRLLWKGELFLYCAVNSERGQLPHNWSSFKT